MTRSLVWWLVQFSINFLSFVIMYLVLYALLKKKLTFNWQHLGLAVLHTIVVSPIDYLIDPYALQIASSLFLLLAVKIITKRKLVDSLLIYGVDTVIVGISQIPALVMAWTLYGLFDLYRPFVFLIAQVLSLTFIILVCQKVKLHQWFHMLQVNIVLKLILFIIVLAILLIAFLVNFDYQLSYLLFYTLTMIWVGAILFPILRKLHHHSLHVISIHDLQNSLLSTGITMKIMNAPEEVYIAFATHAKELGMDLGQLEVTKVEDELAQMTLLNEAVEQFIQMKLKNKKDTKIRLDVTYYEAHEVVDLTLALKWLGTLLDNSLDASCIHPIYIYLFSMDEQFTLKIANEYIGEGQDIQIIFERGYSTKGSGRGIGLHNVYTKVVELGGKVEVDESYHEAYTCYYLQITIKFKKQLINHEVKGNKNDTIAY